MKPPPQHWYVTATHVWRRPGLTRDMPFGTAHVRSPGAAFTACGTPAANWPIFWDVGIDEPLDACAECRRVARSYGQAMTALRGNP